MDISTGRATQLTSGSWDMLPAVTPDGRWVIYTDGGGEVPVIRRVSASGGDPETITAGVLFAPVVSPDGKYLAGFHSRTMLDARALVSIRIEDGEIVERFGAIAPPAKLCARWAADGRGVIVAQISEGGADNLWLYPLGGGEPRQLTKFRSLEIGSFHRLPDGKSYAFSRGRMDSDVVMIANLFER
jgi:Tol biopolymer transport system component